MPRLTRRTVLTGTASCVITRSRARAETPAAPLLSLPDATVLPLWPATPPGGGGPDNHTPHLSPTGSLTGISDPVLQIYRPARPNGAAMIVAAGGGYQHITQRKEATPATRWLQKLGITVGVLTYRLPEEGWRAASLAPFQDAQRAIRLLRTHARQYGIDPDRIGILGFSAGGHLLGLCATRPDWQTYSPTDTADTAPIKVALALLAYPIISLEPPYNHTHTSHTLLGPHPTQADARAWSIPSYIRHGSPPFFLVQAADDPIAAPGQTALLEQACQQNAVPVTRHLFATGGHGFGLGRPGTPTLTWPHLAEQFLHEQSFIS
ncbi:alpha/beta hydrolase [Acetobacter sp.]|uniref:alpha/beta hydrolase n=1 Tax=Acetobacter sp. TaxID=440 RepID=UPI00258461C1|nr:alpha/beta hydrolase [Acetobacter sp.]MCC6105833.1 alpha/beta hydrolase [Acetobacter sp.]